MTTRPDWDQYFLDMVPLAGARATCGRGKSGAIFTKDNRVIAMGYVGAPPGFPHCDEVGHQFIWVTPEEELDQPVEPKPHCIRTIHAEQNAAYDAARRGVPLEGSVLYCTMTPCRTCAMMVVSVGCRRVVSQYRYSDEQESLRIFQIARIPITTIQEEEARYD